MSNTWWLICVSLIMSIVSWSILTILGVSFPVILIINCLLGFGLGTIWPRN